MEEIGRTVGGLEYVVLGHVVVHAVTAHDVVLEPEHPRGETVTNARAPINRSLETLDERRLHPTVCSAPA